jgi:hypothetical protein
MPSEAQILDALVATMDDMSSMVADVKTIVYGDTGMGKTVFGMQMLQRYTPKDKEILYMDTARGWVSFNNHPELKQRVKRMEFQGLSQIDALVAAIKKNDPRFANIGGIMIDEASSVQEMDLEKTRIGRGESTGEFAAPTQPDMGVTTYRFRRTFDPLFRLPQHIVITSHVREDEIKIGNHATGKRQIRPAFMPKVSQMLRGLVHDVLYLTANVDSNGNYSRSLQVMPTPKINCKTRVGGLPPAVTPAQFIKAYDEWIVGGRESNKAELDDGTVTIESDDVGIVVE